MSLCECVSVSVGLCVCGAVFLCLFVEGVGVRQQECVVMQGLFSSIRWAQLGHVL